MNDGNPRVILRMPQKILDLVKAEVDRSKLHRKSGGFDRSSWIRQAVIDKLRHSARSRGASAADLADLDAFPETGI